MSAAEDIVLQAGRVKVRVTCSACGEKYILRGSLGKDGHVETGFKMCLCDSTDVLTEIID